MANLQEMLEKKGKLKNTVTVERQLGDLFKGAASNAVMDQPSEDDIRKIKETLFQTNMDRWIQDLDPADVIPALSRPLPKEIAQKLVVCIKEKRPLWDESGADFPAFVELAAMIDAMILEANKGEPGRLAFVKLSSRSPKDVPTNSDALTACLAPIGDVPQGATTNEQNAIVCRRVAACYRASTDQLFHRSGRDALNLLVQSQRILFDIELDLRFPEQYSTCVIVRPCLDIPLKHEFRAFVFNGRLTAISQYFSQLFFEDLAAEVSTLNASIRAFFLTIQKHLPWDKFIIDFAICNGRPMVLEINDWNRSTGTCLYDWADDIDVLEGKVPSDTIKIRESPDFVRATEFYYSMPPEWRNGVFRGIDR